MFVDQIFNIVKISLPPHTQMIYRFKTISTKIPVDIFTGISALNLKFVL